MPPTATLPLPALEIGSQPRVSGWARVERRLVGALHRFVARHYLRKPELAELLDIKLPDLASVGWAALNELAFRLRLERSARVLSLNVETTNFCNLRCTICPVNRGMVRAKKWLDPAVFERLLDRSPTVKFVLPFQWGEPLLHPEIDRMVRYARDRGVRSMLTTNGTLLDDAMANRLFASGLDRLTVSIDGDAATHEQIRGVPLADVRERTLALRRLRDRRGAAMRIDVSMVLDDLTKPALDHYRAAWAGVADRVQVIPRLASAPRRNACREAWRGALVVLVDGTVTACCADSEGTLKLGNGHAQAPAAILNGAPFRALRRAHRCGEFPAICAGCGEFDGGDVGVNARFS
ncbi:MAG: radical SAM protein [Planctomycetes bacterium]|nr:radical SAM protein [Planctomycetota bacterium]